MFAFFTHPIMDKNPEREVIFMYIYDFNRNGVISIWEIVDGNPEKELYDYILKHKNEEFYCSYNHLRWLHSFPKAKLINSNDMIIKNINIYMLEGRIWYKKFWLSEYNIDKAKEIMKEHLEKRKEDLTYTYKKYDEFIKEMDRV